jgi:hypothetical protein
MNRTRFFLQSAKQDEPKYAGKQQGEARIDDHWPKDFLLEAKTDKNTVGDGGKKDAGEQTNKPGRKEGSEDVERRGASAA